MNMNNSNVCTNHKSRTAKALDLFGTDDWFILIVSRVCETHVLLSAYCSLSLTVSFRDHQLIVPTKRIVPKNLRKRYFVIIFAFFEVIILAIRYFNAEIEKRLLRRQIAE